MTGSAEAYCTVCENSFAPGTIVCPTDGTRLVQFEDKSDQLIGRIIDGRFEVIERLGQGGMGDVYRARQRSVGREVAVKVIKPALSADRTAAKRFLREAKLLSRVSQANVVVVHDTGQDEDGTLYLVMELVSGRTLTKVMLDEERMARPRIISIALQICDALEAAHKIGIIHRDLKPSNILLSTSASGRDSVKVLDFGLAKSLTGDDTASTITNTGIVMGTPLYMSPEMISGDVVDGRSDLYSLGCLLYEMCVGRPPFVADTASLLLSKHISEKAAPIDRPDLGPLPDLIEMLLRKHADTRPASAAEVARTLLGHSEGSLARRRDPSIDDGSADSAVSGVAETVMSTQLHAAAAQKKPQRDARLPLLAVIVLLSAGLAALVLSGLGRHEKSPAAPPAAAQDSPILAPVLDTVSDPDAAPMDPVAAESIEPPDAVTVAEETPPEPEVKRRHTRKQRKVHTPPRDEKPDVPFLAP